MTTSSVTITGTGQDRRLYYRESEYAPTDMYLRDQYAVQCGTINYASNTPCTVCWRRIGPDQRNQNEETVSETTAVQATPVVEEDDFPMEIDMTATDEKAESPEEDLVSIANKMLTFLIQKASAYADTMPATPNWQDWLVPLLTDKEVAAGAKAAEKVSDGYYRVVPNGTTIGNELPGVGPFAAAAAINILKSNGRLVQCGRGRGKALIITSATPLGADTAVLPKAAPQTATVSTETKDDVEVVMSDDVPNLLRAARDHYREIRRGKEEAERNLRTANSRVQELEVALIAKDAEIESWKQRVAVQQLTTWQ